MLFCVDGSRWKGRPPRCVAEVDDIGANKTTENVDQDPLVPTIEVVSSQSNLTVADEKPSSTATDFILSLSAPALVIIVLVVACATIIIITVVCAVVPKRKPKKVCHYVF